MGGGVDLARTLARLGVRGVQVKGVVEGHVVDALDVRLQIPFLRGSVRAEEAAERSLPCKSDRQKEGGTERSQGRWRVKGLRWFS